MSTVNMEVFVKQIKYSPTLPVGTTATELLPLEILHLAKLSHPGIRNLVGYSYSSRTWTLLLEHSERWERLVDLRGTHSRVLDKDDVREIVQQLMEVIVYCWSHGVHHTSLSSENIYLDRDTNRIKLGGFQHSRPLSLLPYTLRSTATSPTCTPPELYRSGSHTAPDAAVWSVGCLLFELLSGHPPVTCLADLATCNLRWEHLSPSRVSKDVYDLIATCLDSDPEHRLSFQDMLNHSWIVNESAV